MINKRFCFGLFLSAIFHFTIGFNFFWNVLGVHQSSISFDVFKAMPANKINNLKSEGASSLIRSPANVRKEEFSENSLMENVGDLKLPNIPYPQVCQKKGIEGSVWVIMVFNDEGEIKTIELSPESRSCPEFSEVVLENLKKFRMPKDKVEENTSVKLTVRFKLRS